MNEQLLRAGIEIGGRYRVERYLAEGGMQQVYLATDTVFQRQVVVKIPKNESAVKRFRASAVLSARVTHPNIAKTLDYVEDRATACLIEEFIEGQDLERGLLSRLTVLDPYLTARTIHHLARAVAAAHHVNVVHRDLKPSNIMVNVGADGFSIKVTDFGIAKMAQETVATAVEQSGKSGGSSIIASKTAVGALPYMAPELILRPRNVEKPSDIWAVGAMGYEFLTGEKPYGEGLAAVAAIVAAEPVKEKPIMTRSRQFIDLCRDVFAIVQRCLARDPSLRPTANELVTACESLCYGLAPRFDGEIVEVRGQTGRIASAGRIVFYHNKSVYGPRPHLGDAVMFACFPGTPWDRAIPVVKLVPAEA